MRFIDSGTIPRAVSRPAVTVPPPDASLRAPQLPAFVPGAPRPAVPIGPWAVPPAPPPPFPPPRGTPSPPAGPAGSHVSSTIVIPAWTHPNYLHHCLHALVKNSYYRHRIVVVWSDPEKVLPGEPTAGDVEVRSDGSTFQRFGSVRELLDDHRPWLADNGIETLDVSEEIIPWRARYERGEVWPGMRVLHGGTDVGYKCNRALEDVRTELVCALWDDDFTAAPGWDRSLIDWAFDPSVDHARECLIPMHTQPALVSAEAAARWDAWRDSPPISNHRLAMPGRPRDGGYYVEEGDVADFVRRTERRHARIVEPAGARAQIHFLPLFLRTEALRATGGFTYQGPGVDLEMDDRLGKLGFKKVAFCDSFIIHKGFPTLQCDAH